MNYCKSSKGTLKVEWSPLYQEVALLAVRLAVRSCAMQFKPYNYTPSLTTLGVDSRELSRRFRSMLNLACAAERQSIVKYLNGEGSAESWVGHQDGLRIESFGPMALADLSTQLDPEQFHGRFVVLAILIRSERLAEAEQMASSLLAGELPPSVRSRLLANLALIHEMTGCGIQARRFASDSVSCSKVSPLAVFNYELYCNQRVIG